ncbi:MAG: hypothetical protein ACRD2X_06580, partial [Vicinamibacteraceae bacterium]
SLTTSWSAGAQTVRAADRLVDSVGVNIHLHYNNTPYRERFPLVERRLMELGVRHVRDGLVDTPWQAYYDRHNALGEAGIKGTFITSPEQSRELWIAYPARMKQSFEAYEAPNEYDLKGRRDDWAPILTDTLRRLRSLENELRATRFPLLGPSLTTAAAYAELGDVSAYYDFANLHNYYGGRHPGTRGWGRNGYGSIGWHFDLVDRYAHGKPIVSTETGYQDDPAEENWVPADVAGRYTPIIILEHFRVGVVRTFLYELIDFPKSGSWGLVESDGTPKPAFTAVKNLLTLLADPGPQLPPEDLEYTVRDDTGDLRHVALRKHDGTAFVALWRVRQSYDQNKGQQTNVAPQGVVMTVPGEMRHVRTHEWQVDGSMSTTAWSSSSAMSAVPVADRLVIVEMAPALPASENR